MIDWANKYERRRWLGELVLAIEDGHAITEDMLRPARERELGPVLHRHNYGEARSKVAHLIAAAMDEEPSEPEEEEDAEPSDPAGSGNGGAGPVH